MPCPRLPQGCEPDEAASLGQTSWWCDVEGINRSRMELFLCGWSKPLQSRCEALESKCQDLARRLGMMEPFMADTNALKLKIIMMETRLLAHSGTMTSLPDPVLLDEQHNICADGGTKTPRMSHGILEGMLERGQLKLPPDPVLPPEQQKICAFGMMSSPTGSLRLSHSMLKWEDENSGPDPALLHEEEEVCAEGSKNTPAKSFHALHEMLERGQQHVRPDSVLPHEPNEAFADGRKKTPADHLCIAEEMLSEKQGALSGSPMSHDHSVEPNFSHQKKAVKSQRQAHAPRLHVASDVDMLMSLLSEKVNDLTKHQDGLKLSSNRSEPCNTSAGSSEYIQKTRSSSAQDLCMKQLPSGIVESCLHKQQQQQGFCPEKVLIQHKRAQQSMESAADFGGRYPMVPYSVRDRVLRKAAGHSRMVLALAEQGQFAGTLPVVPEEKL